MENQARKCRVVENGIECGKDEILAKKKREIVWDPVYGKMTHHECPVHKFHLTLTGDKWKLCDCVD